MSDLPSFERTKSDDQYFWDQRFEAKFTPWDRGGVPHNLAAWLSESGTAARKTLIPGCGVGHEVNAFADAGWPVLAIDFSTAAVAAAAERLGPRSALVQKADFFDPRWIDEGFGLIYECAFLCALPPDRRVDWAAQVSNILTPGGLLVGYFFFATTPKGPPFGITEQELAALLGPNFALLDEAEPPDSISVFRGAERWMVWRRV
jgi:SAM-dependent methyltransferase